jgi:hypothetical protein
MTPLVNNCSPVNVICTYVYYGMLNFLINNNLCEKTVKYYSVGTYQAIH